MTWLTLRLQRGELILLLVAALAVGVAFATTRDDIHDLSVESAYGRLSLACGAPFSYFGETGYCPDGTGSILPLVNESLPYVTFLPLGLAVVMTFPLVMELSSRSYRLAWVQSQTRTAWARGRLLAILLTCLTLTGAAIVLARWWLPWRNPFDSVRGYDAIGIVNLGWTTFAIGLALAAATVWRRPLPMLVVTSGVYFFVRVGFLSNLRAALIPAERVEEPLPAVGNLGVNVWVTGSWYARSDGSRIPEQDVYDLCREQGRDLVNGWLESCLQTNGFTIRVWEYHPASHYWPMQVVETGLLTTIGLALIGWSVWYWLCRLE